MHDTVNTPMPLLTTDQRDHLLANGRQSGRDHVSVVKSELDADGDILSALRS